MADLKNYSSPTDFNIHLSFHLVGDTTFPIQKKFLENLLYNSFGATFFLEHEDPEPASEREVVYRLQRPLVESEYTKYFENLKVVFEETKRYLPSFTQGLEKKK